MNTAGAGPSRRLRSEPFGIVDGTPVQLHTLTGEAGLEVRVTDWGATLTSIRTPDRNGTVGEVLLGLDTLDGYRGPHPYLGATIGRYANRIANARFALDGTEHRLSANEGPHLLHGGVTAFDHRLWRAEPHPGGAAPSVAFHLASADGDNGFPGALQAMVEFTVDGDTLQIDWNAWTDAPTVVNLTNHMYLNLGGGDTVLDHLLQVDADRYLPVDEAMIPTGELRPVGGTPFDFTTPFAVGARIAGAHVQLLHAGGYDHCLVRPDRHGTGTDEGAGLLPFVELVSPASGRRLRLHATQPGVQLYTGNRLDGSLVGAGGRRLVRHAGLCLEPQYLPDSPNRPQFPSTVLRPGRHWHQRARYQFDSVPA